VAEAQIERRGRRGLAESLGVYFSRHAQTLVGSLGRLVRHPFATLFTIAVIGIALALPVGLQLLVTNVRAATGTWRNAVDLSVYFKADVALTKVEQLANKLRARGGVSAVTVVSSDQGIAEFRKFSGFGAALDALTENPLPHVMVVSPAVDRATPADVDSLRAYLGNWPEVDLVQVDTEWVARFQSILEVMRGVAGLATVLLAIGVIVIVGNTIRLDILSRRAEIEVTKLVGGSDAFVRRPFLYSGIWYGLGGAALALAIVDVAAAVLREPVGRVAMLYGSQFQLIGLNLDRSVMLLGAGILLGLIGSWITASHHLRAIEPTA
jgi:cell division transport system permease protein